MRRPVPVSPCGFRHLAAAILFAALACVASAQPAFAIDVERVRSPGGIEAWLVRDHTNPLLYIEFAFRGGARHDPAGKEGATALTADLLGMGAGDLPHLAFSRQLDERAIQMNFYAGPDSLGGSLSTLTEHLDSAERLLGLALTAPRFDEETVEQVRAQTVTSLRRRLEQPDTVAQRVLYAGLYPNHPYGSPVSGTVESVASITAGDLRDIAGRQLARGNLYIGVTGDIEPERLGRLLDAVFGKLPAKPDLATVERTRPKANGGVQVVRMKVPQSTILFAQHGLARNDPDFYAATVLNHMLGGGGFTSMLYKQVRERRGLAYSVGSYLQPLDRSALLIGSAGTANARVADTVKVIRDQWSAMAEKGVTQAQLDDAKTFLTGSFPLRFSSSGRIAGILVAMQLDELGIDFLDRRNALIEGVTLAHVNVLAKRLLAPDQLTFVVVGDPVNMTGSADLPGGRPPGVPDGRSDTLPAATPR